MYDTFELCSNPFHFLFSPPRSLRWDANLLLSSSWLALLWQHVAACLKGTQRHFTEKCIWYEDRFCLEEDLLRNGRKRQDLSGRVLWRKRAYGGESGRRWCINTPIRAAATLCLSWGFAKFGCEKSQRSVGTDHLVLVILKKQNRMMVCWNSGLPNFSTYSLRTIFQTAAGKETVSKWELYMCMYGELFNLFNLHMV